MAYNPKKLGFYRVGDKSFYSKYDAIIEYKETGNKIMWDFNNDIYCRFPWKREPKESLQDLYLKRAKQLREDYDYLVLFYSGGSDSQTILNTFVNNNIHIDEIATCYSLEGAGPNGYFNEEIIKVAIPHMDRLKNHLTNTKFRIIDQTNMILEWFSSNEDWYKYQNTILTPNCVTRARLRDLIDEYNDLEKNTNMGFIWGIEKPSIFLDKDRFYLQIFDAIDSNTSPYSQLQGWKDEFFFFDPAHLKLAAKQAHLLIKALRNNSIPTNLFSLEKSKYGKVPGTNEFLTANGCSYVIYPTWNINTFSNGKNPSMVYGARDTWFVNNHKDSLAYKNWINGVNIIQETYQTNNSDVRFLNSDDMFDGIVAHKSLPYYLE